MRVLSLIFLYLADIWRENFYDNISWTFFVDDSPSEKFTCLTVTIYS